MRIINSGATPDINCIRVFYATAPALLNLPMNSFHVDPSWGVPLDVYLKEKQHLPLPVYPIDVVTSSLESISLDSSEIISDSTLEAILSLVHHPEHLGLLVDTRFTSVWFSLLEQYLEDYSVSCCL